MEAVFVGQMCFCKNLSSQNFINGSSNERETEKKEKESEKLGQKRIEEGGRERAKN